MFTARTVTGIETSNDVVDISLINNFDGTGLTYHVDNPYRDQPIDIEHIKTHYSHSLLKLVIFGLVILLSYLYLYSIKIPDQLSIFRRLAQITMISSNNIRLPW